MRGRDGAKENTPQASSGKRKAPPPASSSSSSSSTLTAAPSVARSSGPTLIDLDEESDRSDELLDQSSQPAVFAALNEVSDRAAATPPSLFADPYANEDATTDAVAAWAFVEDEVLPEEEQLALAQAMSLSVQSEARQAAAAAPSASSEASLVRARVTKVLDDATGRRSALAPTVPPVPDTGGYRPGDLWRRAGGGGTSPATGYVQRVPMLDALSEWEAARDCIVLDWSGDPADRGAILERLGEAALRREAQLERDPTRRQVWSKLLGTLPPDSPDDSPTGDHSTSSTDSETAPTDSAAATAADAAAATGEPLPADVRMELLSWCRSSPEGLRVWRSAHAGSATFGTAAVSVADTLLLIGASGIEVTEDELVAFMTAYAIPHKR